MQKQQNISVVVPAFNEQKILRRSIITLYNFLTRHYPSFELIIADDGSTDATPAIAKKLQKEYPRVALLRTTPNHGRGWVLTNAFSHAKSDIVCYVDCDLAINIDLLPLLCNAVKAKYDIATGSKHAHGACVTYGFFRRIASIIYSKLSRIILNCPLKDYQCGMKAFKKSSFMKLRPHLSQNGWAWDTEVLALAYHSHMQIAELPARVNNVQERKSKVVIFRDGYRMLQALIAIRRKVYALKS